MDMTHSSEQKGDKSPLTEEARPSKQRALLEALLIFGGTTLLCSVLWQLRSVSVFIRQNLAGIIAALFLYIPTLLLMKRKEDFEAYGLTYRPLKRGLFIFFVVSLVIFPLFALGFYFYYHLLCGALLTHPLVQRLFRGLCSRWVDSPSKIVLRLPKKFGLLLLNQLIVGLSEEYFFRGYLQSRLEVVWPSRRRFLGARVGLALLVTSALFALGHVLVDFNGLRLAVFFPALVFGWMRLATGSILAPVLFHACSNIVSELLHGWFFNF